MFLVCNKTKELVDKWYDIGCNYHMIDDSPSISNNLNYFMRHRHDQSIFSLLTKKYNIYSRKSLYECIDVLRNNTGVSKLNKKNKLKHYGSTKMLFN
jgi:hypothetical protein